LSTADPASDLLIGAGGLVGGAYGEYDERRPIIEYGRQKVELEGLALPTGGGLVYHTSGVFGLEPRRKNFVCQLVDRLRAGPALRCRLGSAHH